MLYDIAKIKEIIKSSTPLADYMQEDLEVHVQNAAYTKFLCPFHQDKKTPSLTVYHDSDSYYCFGCKETGDIISWAMYKYGVNFTEALEKLASELDIDADQYKREQS